MAQSQRPQADSAIVLGLDGSPGTALASTRDPLRRLPGSPTVQQIRRAIPAQLCRPSLVQSISYVARDLLQVAAAAWTTMVLLRHEVAPGWLVWLLYWLVQGTNFWALLVLGHDCGHGSFASSEWMNDCVGWLLHTPLLVPYYPWKLTHRHHHRHTAGLFSCWGAGAVACYYLVPVWICGSWLVAVTLLHHLDESCEYTSDSWTMLATCGCSVQASM
eukprot:g27629.t1